jgi:hypothetical protein
MLIVGTDDCGTGNLPGIFEQWTDQIYHILFLERERKKAKALGVMFRRYIYIPFRCKTLSTVIVLIVWCDVDDGRPTLLLDFDLTDTSFHPPRRQSLQRRSSHFIPQGYHDYLTSTFNMGMGTRPATTKCEIGSFTRTSEYPIVFCMTRTVKSAYGDPYAHPDTNRSREAPLAGRFPRMGSHDDLMT